jgi:ribosomal protein S18 acetylase RimI-like enzyme
MTPLLAETPAAGSAALRPMTAADLEPSHALSAELRWPHRPVDWAQTFAHAEGFVAEIDGRVVATAQRWRWGDRHASIGLVIVSPACRGRRIGNRLMTALLDGLEGCTVLLHATPEGRGLYERLGFARIGELSQHQGTAQSVAPVALPAGCRLRPAGANELPALQALDAEARGMPRQALIADLLGSAESCVVFDRDNEPRGFAMLRRFGRGHVIGPVVAPDAECAKALIAHLVSTNAGNFTRIDIDKASDLMGWLESTGLPSVDEPTTMLRGELPAPAPGGARLFAIVTQALG